MADERKKDDPSEVYTEEMKAEDLARLKKKWDEMEDQPSQAPGFEGATPRKLARALFKLGRKS